MIRRLRIRYRKSNADVTTSNYWVMADGAYVSVGSFGHDLFYQRNTNYARVNYNEFGSTEGFSNAILTFYDPASTTTYKTCQVDTISSVSTGDEISNKQGLIQLRDNTNALSGVTIYPTTGNLYATLKLYGVK